MKHPINLENRHSEDDIEFKYNPNKGKNNWPSTHEETFNNKYNYEGGNQGATLAQIEDDGEMMEGEWE